MTIHLSYTTISADSHDPWISIHILRQSTKKLSTPSLGWPNIKNRTLNQLGHFSQKGVLNLLPNLVVEYKLNTWQPVFLKCVQIMGLRTGLFTLLYMLFHIIFLILVMSSLSSQLSILPSPKPLTEFFHLVFFLYFLCLRNGFLYCYRDWSLLKWSSCF